MERQLVTWAALALGLVATRLVEGRLHRAHYRLLVAAGARETAPWAMRLYYLLCAAILPAAALEQLLVARPVPPGGLAAGLFLVGTAAALRLWAIRSLGVRWTMRCLALPGARALNLGPYRLTPHPEYLSRLVEALGLALAFSAPLTLAAAVLATGGLAALAARREAAQLAAAAAPGVDLDAAVE